MFVVGSSSGGPERIPIRKPRQRHTCCPISLAATVSELRYYRRREAHPGWEEGVGVICAYAGGSKPAGEVQAAFGRRSRSPLSAMSAALIEILNRWRCRCGWAAPSDEAGAFCAEAHRRRTQIYRGELSIVTAIGTDAGAMAKIEGDVTARERRPRPAAVRLCCLQDPRGADIGCTTQPCSMFREACAKLSCKYRECYCGEPTAGTSSARRVKIKEMLVSRLIKAWLAGIAERHRGGNRRHRTCWHGVNIGNEGCVAPGWPLLDAAAAQAHPGLMAIPPPVNDDARNR